MFFTIMLHAQIFKELNLNAGGLSSALDLVEKSTITSLKLTGTIDSRDFRTMRDSMPVLSVIDLEGTTVKAYSGTMGTSGDDIISYAQDRVPGYAFKNPNSSYGKAGLTSVILPSSITLIGENAFAYCQEITSVVMPSSVDSIGFCAFQYCGLMDLGSLPSSLVFIGGSAFMNCTALSNLDIPASVISIGNNCFYGCNGLSSIHIPASVTSIEAPAFPGCTGNVTVDPGNNDYSAIDGVLYNKDNTLLIHCPASKTGSFAIPASVKTIENSAFYNCKDLTEITIPLSVTALRESAFLGCNAWDPINIPASVISVGFFAFNDCTGNISVNNDNPEFSSLEGLLFDKTQSRILYCPQSKTGSYIIPSTVTTIDNYAFYKCSHLSSVTIPSSVTSIKMGAFFDCNQLKSIIVQGNTPVDISSSGGVFFNISKETCTLFIPAASLQNYQEADQWNGFTHIMEGNAFWISDSEITFQSAADTSAAIVVTSNSEWAVSYESDWLTVSPIHGGLGTDTLMIIVTENPDVNIRTSAITISADGILPQTISVTQEGTPTGMAGVKKEDLILYPNPSENIIYLNDSKVLVSIYNSNGTLVIKKLVNDNQIDINELNRGVFTIIIEGRGRIVTRKFVKL
jgi:hypothetical protein